MSNSTEISQENMGNSAERMASIISTPSGGADYLPPSSHTLINE